MSKTTLRHFRHLARSGSKIHSVSGDTTGTGSDDIVATNNTARTVAADVLITGSATIVTVPFADTAANSVNNLDTASAGRETTRFDVSGSENAVRCCSRPVSHNRSRRKVVNNINTIEPATILANRGRCLSTVLGDGNCFFRCIALASTGSDEQHRVTREQVVNFMTVHAETLFLQNSMQMNTSNVWLYLQLGLLMPKYVLRLPFCKLQYMFSPKF